MDCDTARRLLGPHLDGELDAHRVRLLSEHLHSCCSCASHAGEEKEIRAVIESGAPSFSRRPGALSPGLLLLQARRQRSREAALVASLKRMAAAAAVLLVTSTAAGGALLWQRPAPAQAPASIQAMATGAAAPRLEVLIDESNSIVMALGGLGG